MSTQLVSSGVAYVVDPQLLAACDAVPVLRHRASMTHSLISAYGLLPKLLVVPSQPATEEDIRAFHSEEYVKLLRTGKPDSEDEDEEDEYGLGFDCPILPNLWGVVCRLAGGSLTAARVLVEGQAKVAINWCGGWHHAQRDSASGFCYVNDIVLAIRLLRTKFERVLYIDLDVHHGDGVENAFLFTPKVVCLSLHQLEPGFFPGSGPVVITGEGKGRGFTFNIPYKAGINNKEFVHLFESVVYNLCEVYLPHAIVCQCGADALVGDPLGGANITIEAFNSCIQHVLNINKPTLFLGGGGYNKVNSAKLWTSITSTILGSTLAAEIPEHHFFPLYGPSFELEVTAGLRKSENTQAFLDNTLKATYDNIEKMAQLLGKRTEPSTTTSAMECQRT